MLSGITYVVLGSTFYEKKITVRSKFVFQLLRMSIYKHNDDCKYIITHEPFNTSFSITLVM